MTTRNAHIRTLYRNGASITTICKTFALTRAEAEAICDATVLTLADDPVHMPVKLDNARALPPNVVVWTSAAPQGVRGDAIKWED